MKSKLIFTVTRDKHLDHMVRVVPIIVLGYALQSYVILNMDKSVGSSTLLVLGACLVSMIVGFIAYDNYHKVNLFEHHLTIEWFFYKKNISYAEITNIHVVEDKNNFASVTLKLDDKKVKIFFVDQALEVKSIIEAQKNSQEQKAA